MAIVAVPNRRSDESLPFRVDAVIASFLAGPLFDSTSVVNLVVGAAGSAWSVRGAPTEVTGAAGAGMPMVILAGDTAISHEIDLWRSAAL